MRDENEVKKADNNEADETGVKEAGADATTGASPGTAQACDDLDLNSLDANLERFGIKPPGVS